MSHLTYSRSLTATTRVSLNSLANENLYLTCFSINSGLTHTNICGCIQLLNDIWFMYSRVPTTAWFTLITWNSCPCDIQGDSAGTYSRVPYCYDSGILLELHQWRFFWPTIPIYHLTWEFIVLLSRHPTSPVVHSVVSEPKRDSSMFFLSIDSRTHEICWQEMDLWCIISKYMDVLKGEGSLLLSTQPNIQSCYFTVSSHKHTHAIQFTLPVGKGIFKRYHSYGYVWFLHTKPSPLYGLHTPGFFPRCTQSILLRCCVWKLCGEGSLMLSYEGFNHIHYCPSELPLAKGMLEGGQSSSPDPTMHTCTSSLTDQPLTSGSGYPTGDIRTPSIPQPYQPYNASQLDSRMDDEELLKHPTKGLFFPKLLNYAKIQ